MRIRILSCALMLVAAATFSSSAQAQGGTYGGAVLAPGVPPVTLTGTSGGPRQASSVRSYCRGSIAHAPDHVFTVVTPMTVRFEVIQAPGDTTLVIMGPTGVHCDDDGGSGFNPRVVQSLAPGQYQVYVGSYGRSALHPYTLQAVAQGGMPIAPPAAMGGGRYGGAMLSPASMFAKLTGTSRGPMQASTTRGSHCRGYVAAVPDHVLTVTSPMVVTFDVSANGDTTLILVGPTGVQCNDDGGNGSNPRLTQALQPGMYQVFVGSYSSGNFFPYNLSIHP